MQDDSTNPEALDERPDMQPEPSNDRPDSTFPKDPNPSADDEGSKRGIMYRIRTFIRSLSRGRAKGTEESTSISSTAPA